MSNNLFSIVIPAYSEEENINDLLEEIEKTFKDEVDLEIILVDDGSPVSLEDVIKKNEYKFNIQIVTNRYNLGQSKSIF